METLGASRNRILALVVLVAFTALLQYNVPGILYGYGPITFATVLAALELEPRRAGLAVLAGELIALPFQLASKSILAPVALLGLALRPPTAYYASRLSRRLGSLSGAIGYAMVSSVLALGAAILYYGDNGIHAGLAAFNIIPALYALAVHETLHTPGTRAHYSPHIIAASYALLAASTAAYLAPAGVLGSLALLALWLYNRGRSSATANRGVLLAATIAIIAASLAASATQIGYNARILSYPLNPHSYTSDRWRACGTDDIMAGVHDPARLRIVSECQVVRVRVEGVPFQADDGDICFDAKPLHSNPLYESLGTLLLRRGLLHAEIIPANHSLLARLNNTICVGDTLTLKGPVVVDTDHGLWSEVHPVKQITLIERGSGPCITFHEANTGK